MSKTFAREKKQHLPFIPVLCTSSVCETTTVSNLSPPSPCCRAGLALTQSFSSVLLTSLPRMFLPNLKPCHTLTLSNGKYAEEILALGSVSVLLRRLLRYILS